jgi:hypothetical protein
MPAFPKTTTERIAACASVGLHFWSDSPVRSTVWASGDDRRYHLVRLDRKTRTATHVCGEGYEAPGMVITRRCFHGLSVGRWDEIGNGSMLEAAAALLGR